MFTRKQTCGALCKAFPRARKEKKGRIDSMNIAVITGASSGMGRDFALQLDASQSFDEIWLIARRAEKLEELKKELKAPARVLSLDLEKDESLEAYASLLKETKPDIRVLVNAAGFGRFTAFEKDDLSTQLSMARLNDLALVGVTWLSLQYMHPGSCVYQLGSMSAWQPVPYMSIYAASKAFVLSFTRALNVELKGRGIRLMAVCPGWVRTEFFDRARHDDTVCYYNRWYESKDVVKKALKDMKKGKDVSVLGFPERLQVLLVKLLPHRLVMKVWCRQQKH